MKTTSTEINEVAAALAAVQGAARNLKEEGRNNFQKFDFISIGQVTCAARPLLREHGLALVWSTESVVWGEKDGKQRSAIVEVSCRIVHAASGQWLLTRWYGEGMDTADKVVTKAYTYAQKAALMRLLMIASGDGSDDPDAFSPQYEAPRRRDDSGERRRPRPPKLDRGQICDSLEQLVRECGFDDADLAAFWALLVESAESKRLAESPSLPKIAKDDDVPTKFLDVTYKRLAAMDKTERTTAIAKQLPTI